MSYMTTNKEFRPIHYLGSKLRMLEFIGETIQNLNPEGGVVCDLFAGSGVVSKHLSLMGPVISNDIQEYSRIICSALLLPHNKVDLNSFGNLSKTKTYTQLFFIFEPLISYEQQALDELKHGDMNKIGQIINYGSFINYANNDVPVFDEEFKNAFEETKERLKNSELHHSKKTMISRYYGGLYFSYLQAVALDTLLELKDDIDIESRSIFHAAILSSASDAVNTIGKQFAQPINPVDSEGKPKLRLAKKISRDRSIDIFDIFEKWINRYNRQDEPKFENTVTKLDYSEVLEKRSNISVVYADPPYTRYHYSRYYHVLESIGLQDIPEITFAIKNNQKIHSKAIYRNDRRPSSFGLKGESNHSFDNLFKKTSEINASLVLSYSPYNERSNATPRIQTIDGLLCFAKKYFKDVNIVTFGKFSHSKLNNIKFHMDASDMAEVLIVCKN